MAAAKKKASRPAIPPQLRPQDKVSLPVASFVMLSGRDGTNKVCMSLPVLAPSRPHRQNKKVSVNGIVMFSSRACPASVSSMYPNAANASSVLASPSAAGVHLDTVLVAQPSPAAGCRSVPLRGPTAGWIHAAGRRPNPRAWTPAPHLPPTMAGTVSRCTHAAVASSISSSRWFQSATGGPSPP